MKRSTTIFGTIILLGAIMGSLMAWGLDRERACLAEDKITNQSFLEAKPATQTAEPRALLDTLTKSGPQAEETYQIGFSDVVRRENSALNEKVSKAMDNVHATSFADDMAQFSHGRAVNNTDLTALRLLEARISFESIYHAMEESDADAIGRELEKPPEDIDVDLILDTISKTFPSVRGS